MQLGTTTSAFYIDKKKRERDREVERGGFFLGERIHVVSKMVLMPEVRVRLYIPYRFAYNLPPRRTKERFTSY